MKVKEEGGIFDEKDVRYINPREYHRKIISDLEDLGYSVPRNVAEYLDVKKEIIGDKTGYVTSRVEGFRRKLGSGTVRYRPNLQVGVGLAIVGILFIIVASFIYSQIAVIGVPPLILGVVLASRQKISPFPVLLRSSIKILAEGEVTERMVEKEGAKVTDLLAQLTVSLGANTYVQALIGQIHDTSLRNAVYSIPYSLTPLPLSSSPLADYVRESTKHLVQSELKQLREGFERLTQRLETHGHKL